MFKDLAEEVLKEVKKPLSVIEVWEYGKAKNLTKKLDSNGATPEKTLSARLHTDIKNNTNSIFKQVSKMPSLFYLKNMPIENIE